MGLSRRRLRRLEGKGGRSPLTALQEGWAREAARRLTDRELVLVVGALRREEHLEGEEFPQTEISPEEKAALDAFYGFYEEARLGA